MHRASQLIEVTFVQLILARSNGSDQTFRQRLERNIDWHFDLLYESFAGIGGETRGIANSKRSGRFHFDLKGLAIDLGHSLHFLEADVIVILERVAFVVV